MSHEVTLEILPKLRFFVAIELSQDEFLHASVTITCAPETHNLRDFTVYSTSLA